MRKQVNRAIIGAVTVSALLGAMNRIEYEVKAGDTEPAEILSANPMDWVYGPIKNGVLELRKLTHDGSPDMTDTPPHDQLPLPGPGPDVEGPNLHEDSRS